MKVCVAQTRPLKGDIAANIERHQAFLDIAVNNGANLVVFPELSLTGYEPSLAHKLAVDASDRRLDVFQTISDAHKMVLAVGVPIQQGVGVCISLVLFQPDRERRVYSKQYLHADEVPFFVCGNNIPIINVRGLKIALAICYELSVSEHAEQAHRNGADIYISSVAKSASGVEKASERLAAIARDYSMTVLMSNCIGQTDDFVSAGQTAVWSRHGERFNHLDNAAEGLLIFDTDTQLVTKGTVSNLSFAT